MTDFYPDDGWNTYCENCDSSPNPDDYTTIINGYEERYVCPHCRHVEPPILSEDAQCLGDYILSIADDDWSCGFDGAIPPFPRYEA